MTQKERIQYLNNMLTNAYHEIEDLKKQCFHLAANQCRFPYSGEGGDPECSEINRLKSELHQQVKTK